MENVPFQKDVIMSDARTVVMRTLEWNRGSFHGSKEGSFEVGEQIGEFSF